MERVISIDGLDAIMEQLRNLGHVVVGPTVRDGAITHDEIHDTSELPCGWSDAQSPGMYRLVATGTDELFGFSSPSESWKRFVYPPRTLLIRARRTDDGIAIEPPPEPEPTAVAFFGIRSCDLAALGVLDGVFGDRADHPDPEYHHRRSNAFIVAVGCARPSQSCFCASMNTGPTPTEGYDLAIAEMADGESRYMVTTGTQRGIDLLNAIDGRRATDADRSQAAYQHDRAVAAMTRTIDPSDPPRAAEHLDHPQWAAIGDRCLACASCTMVCPTCFCNTTEEKTSLDGNQTERHRVWDSCFTLGFSSMQEGAVRASISSRYRQWLLHKLVTWHDQFGSSGCVGCGRCITWCPVGIDLTEEIASLAQASGTER